MGSRPPKVDIGPKAQEKTGKISAVPKSAPSDSVTPLPSAEEDSTI